MSDNVGLIKGGTGISRRCPGGRRVRNLGCDDLCQRSGFGTGRRRPWAANRVRVVVQGRCLPAVLSQVEFTVRHRGTPPPWLLSQPTALRQPNLIFHRDSASKVIFRRVRGICDTPGCCRPGDREPADPGCSGRRSGPVGEAVLNHEWTRMGTN
jgi:hypothetical protein